MRLEMDPASHHGLGGSSIIRLKWKSMGMLEFDDGMNSVHQLIHSAPNDECDGTIKWRRFPPDSRRECHEAYIFLFECVNGWVQMAL